MKSECIVVNPMKVLIALAPASDQRASLPFWIWAERMMGSNDSSSMATALNFLVRHCTDLDKLRSQERLSDLSLVDAVRQDLDARGTRVSALATAIAGETASDFALILDQQDQNQPIEVARVRRIRGELEGLLTKLHSVSVPDVSVLTSNMAHGLVELDLLLQRSEDMGLWLLASDSLIVGQDRLVQYGLTLERLGMPKAAKLAIALAFALAGLFPPLALAAMGGSLALLAADGWNEEEFFATRAALQRRPESGRPQL